MSVYIVKGTFTGGCDKLRKQVGLTSYGKPTTAYLFTETRACILFLVSEECAGVSLQYGEITVIMS